MFGSAAHALQLCPGEMGQSTASGLMPAVSDGCSCLGSHIRQLPSLFGPPKRRILELAKLRCTLG